MWLIPTNNKMKDWRQISKIEKAPQAVVLTEPSLKGSFKFLYISKHI